ncbi:MAG: hypothetical protein O8C61_12105 [Candidatus Methanoperedens sp.]|nr:hypothetical protein [Candidatus Methanoperedens sp.]
MIPTKNSLGTRYFLKSQDAVAEVLDFITIVGILLICFSIIGLVGYPALRSAQEARYIENTKQTFIVLADNFNKVASGQAPSHGGVIKMYGGRLSVTGNSTIQINVTDSSGNEKKLEGGPMRSIENSIGDTVVAYEGTGVWVKYPNGYVLNVYKPLITNRSDMLIIPVTYISGYPSTSGTGMSKITVCQQQIPSQEGGCGMPELIHNRSVSSVTSVTIIITGDYTSGWQDYFINTMKWSKIADGTFRLNTTTNPDVYILKSQIYTEII